MVVSGVSLIGLGVAIAQQAGGTGPAPDGMSDTEAVAATGVADPGGGQTSAMRLPIPKKSRAPRKSTAPAVRMPFVTDIHAQAEAATLNRMTTYQGTVINLQSADRLGNVKIQQAIALAFKNLDPEVPQRSAHFQWVSRFPGTNPVGWSGNIIKLEPTTSGWLAEIEFSPLFAPRGGHVTTMDRWVERWLYSPAGLEPIPYLYVPNPAYVGTIIQD